MTATNPSATAGRRVLILDADGGNRRALGGALEGAGFAVRDAESIAAAEDALAGFAPDLVVLDLRLPDGSGLEFAARVRNGRDEVGTIIVTRSTDIRDKLAGLAVADDFVTRPVGAREVVARARAVLRRSARPVEGVLRFADLSLNEQTHEAWRAGRRLDLTPREFELLRYLMLNPRLVLSKGQILANVWGSAGDRGSNGAVETYVSYLRKKLDDAGRPLIRTVRLVGYALTDDDR